MPGTLDALSDHLRRTTRPDGTRDPVEGLPNYDSSATGRRDRYSEAYQGRIYPFTPAGAHPDWGRDEALEAVTRGMQMLFHPHRGTERLPKMAREDPGFLDLLLGVLLDYDP